MMPHNSQHIACLTGLSAAGCLFANRLRAASPTEVFVNQISDGPLSLPRAIGMHPAIVCTQHTVTYSECPADDSFSYCLETAMRGLLSINKA